MRRHGENTCTFTLRQHTHYVGICILCTHSHITVCPNQSGILFELEPSFFFSFFFPCIERLCTHNVSETPITINAGTL